MNIEAKITPRLKMIFDLVPKCGTVADIGCDHGYLSIFLLQKGICERAVASDVNPKPLDAARKNAAIYGVSDKTEFVLSDGLDKIDAVDVCIIAGMGGELICDILKRRKEGQKRFVLQPQRSFDVLRSFLAHEGFEIKIEALAREGGRMYCAFYAEYTGIKREIGFSEALCGKRELLKKCVLCGEYMDYRKNEAAAALKSVEEAGGSMARKGELKELCEIYDDMKAVTVGDIENFIYEAAPKEGAADFDNIGLLLGRRGEKVTRILTTLDLTLDVAKEAAEKGCEMIVSHHPIIFKPINRVTEESEEGETLLFLAEHKIAAFAAHTNLDFADGGLNDYFLKKLDMVPCGSIAENEGRIAKADMTVEELCKKVADTFDLSTIRTTLEGNEKISRVAVCTGSGKSLIAEAAEKADVYITGEVGHHDALFLREKGCGYIEISHFDSEKIVKELLCEMIKGQFDVEVFQSERNVNPMRTVVYNV